MEQVGLTLERNGIIVELVERDGTIVGTGFGWNWIGIDWLDLTHSVTVIWTAFVVYFGANPEHTQRQN